MYYYVIIEKQYLFATRAIFGLIMRRVFMNGVFHPGETYQVPGGHRVRVISVTPDPQENDVFLVLQDEDGGPQGVQSVGEFARRNPELVVTVH